MVSKSFQPNTKATTKTKTGVAGVFIAGSKIKLEEIATQCNAILESRWEKAKKAGGAIESFQNLYSQELASGTPDNKSIKKNIKKKQTESEREDIARIEFVHLFVCNIKDLIKQESWNSYEKWDTLENFDYLANFDKLVTKEIREKIENKVHKWLDNTQFQKGNTEFQKENLKKLKIGSNGYQFKRAKKFLAECGEKNLHFLIGIEPLSINSILSGYGKTLGDFCFFLGAREEAETLKDAAVREAQEEGAIDVGALIEGKKDNNGFYFVVVDESVTVEVKTDKEKLVTLSRRTKSDEKDDMKSVTKEIEDLKIYS